MFKRIFAERYCPVCGGAVSQLNREMDGTDVAAMLVADWPFWLLFGLCSALGLWHWAAGAVAAAVSLVIFFAYGRSRARFRCKPCDQTFGYAYLTREERRPRRGA
jgi:hypothetical protein